MPDAITEQERDAIQEAIARGAVTRCPTGADSGPVYQWNGAQLVNVSDHVAKFRKRRPVGVSAAVEARRQRVLDRVRRGDDPVAVARDEGVSETTVRNDLRAMGRTLIEAQREGAALGAVPAADPGRAEKIDRLRARFPVTARSLLAGLNGEEAGAQEGVQRAAIYRRLARYGLTMADFADGAD